MPSEIVSRFIQALEELEQRSQPEQMLELFEDRATLQNTASPHVFEGKKGARDFWRSYRAAFDEIASRFTKVIESSGIAALEWRAKGTLASGEAVDYGGVTLLEFEEDHIKRFSSYFSPLDLPRARHSASGTRAKATSSANANGTGRVTDTANDGSRNVQLSEEADVGGELTDASYASPGRTT